MTGAEFRRRLSDSAAPVVIDFWAPWCGPCRTISPMLDDIATQFGDRIVLWKINVDEDADVARTFGVRGVPTIAVFRDGAEIARAVGLRSRTEVLELFERAIDDLGARRFSMSRLDRVLRLGTAMVLGGLAWFTGAAVLFVAAALVLASAVHDVLLPRRSRRRP